MKKITLEKLNYYKGLAITKVQIKDRKVPVKRRKRTLRDRIQTAPLNLFNRKDTAGNRICRNIFCIKPPKDGYYCSVTCKKKFFDYYEKKYMWANVRLSIFKRDKYICVICRRFNVVKDLECDHIKPVSLMAYYGYTKVNLKAFDEYIYNEKNLRTLCKACHKNVTLTYMSNKEYIKNELKAG